MLRRHGPHPQETAQRPARWSLEEDKVCVGRGGGHCLLPTTTAVATDQRPRNAYLGSSHLSSAGGRPISCRAAHPPLPWVPGVTYCSQSGSAAGYGPGSHCWPDRSGPQDSWGSGGHGTGHLGGDHRPGSSHTSIKVRPPAGPGPSAWPGQTLHSDQPAW